MLENKRLNLRRVLLFLILTFGLSWGLNWMIASSVGQDTFNQVGLPPVGMLVPAFVALMLQVIAFADSRVHYKKPIGKIRWVITSFILLTLLLVACAFLGVFTTIAGGLLQVVGSVASILWTLLLIRLYQQGGDDTFERAGLQLGDRDTGVKFVIGVVLFILSQALLNWVFGLGRFQGIRPDIEGIPIPGGLYPIALVGFLFLAAVGTPLSSLAFMFGEEYAWRGFLQSELMKIGRRRGVFTVGLIWGLWHIPIIFSGIHTYPPSLVGFGMAFVFFILWGYVQSYAVLKTGSIWVAAFLHGVVNSVYAFSLQYLVRPDHRLLSFGLGAYGLVCLAVVVLLILRDPIWKPGAMDDGSRETVPAYQPPN